MFKNFFKELMCFLPLRLRVSIKFFVRNRYLPNFSRPLTFNEKITNRKLFDDNELFVFCADKFSVRRYVENKVGEKYLIPLFYQDCILTPEIVLDVFKKHGPCVFKVNHNSGGIFFVRNVENVDYANLCKSITSQLNKKYGKYHDEMWYDKIDPMIIAEKLILNENGSIPEDYKFHIFKTKNGPHVVIQVDYDRFSGHNRTFYNTNGEILPFVNKYPNKFKEFKNKNKIDAMLPVALKLAEDFDYVRVDLYFVQGHVYFGELTFSHGSGLDNFETYDQDLLWGSFWESFVKHGK